MGGQSREGIIHPNLRSTILLTHASGGKVKPLKAPKKEKKELDEDELAFKQKQAAGMIHRIVIAICRPLTAPR